MTRTGHDNLLTILTAAAALLASPALGQVVRLRSEAQIRQSDVRLRDVAFCSDLPDDAGDVVVLALDNRQRTARVEFGDLQSALRLAGINPVPIRFSGAAWCAVRRLDAPSSTPAQPASLATYGASDRTAAVETLDRQREPEPSAPYDGPDRVAAGAGYVSLGQAIVDQVAAELGVPVSDVAIEFTGASAENAGRRADGPLSIMSTDSRSLGRRRWRVSYEAGGLARSRWLNGTVALRRRVAVADRQIEAGRVVGADMVRTAWIQDDGSGNWLTDEAGVIGRVARKPLQPGEPFDEDDMEAPILVQRGQSVWVTCGFVQVTARALSDGRAGESLQLENPASGRRFSAMVTGPGMAELRMPGRELEVAAR